MKLCFSFSFKAFLSLTEKKDDFSESKNILSIFFLFYQELLLTFFRKLYIKEFVL